MKNRQDSTKAASQASSNKKPKKIYQLEQRTKEPRNKLFQLFPSLLGQF
jgi:hypothetical protein